MSTPFRLYDPAFEGERCCNELIPLPAWWLFRSGIEVPGLNSSAAGKASKIGPNVTDDFAKRLFDPYSAAEIYYCRACSTVLEDARDSIEAVWNDAKGAIAIVLKAVATVVSFVPGIGTVAAGVLAGAASLAQGNSITDAALDAAAGALPGGVIVQTAFQAGRDFGGALIDGRSIDDALLATARGQARLYGGELAAAAFDAALILARGQALQDAGFAALKGFVKGNTAAEQAIAFAEKATRAAFEGKALEDILVDDLGAELLAVAGDQAGARLEPLLDHVLFDPSLRDIASEALAVANAVPEPIARAAQALVRPDGTVDTAKLDRVLGRTATEHLLARNPRVALAAGFQSTYRSETSAEKVLERQAQAAVLRADPTQKWTYKGTVTLNDALAADPSMSWSSQHPAAKAPAPAIVGSATPVHGPAAPTWAYGVGVAGALVLLYVWASDGGRA